MLLPEYDKINITYSRKKRYFWLKIIFLLNKQHADDLIVQFMYKM